MATGRGEKKKKKTWLALGKAGARLTTAGLAPGARPGKGKSLFGKGAGLGLGLSGRPRQVGQAMSGLAGLAGLKPLGAWRLDPGRSLTLRRRLQRSAAAAACKCVGGGGRRRRQQRRKTARQYDRWVTVCARAYARSGWYDWCRVRCVRVYGYGGQRTSLTTTRKSVWTGRRKPDDKAGPGPTRAPG